jgi:hypothetical protein
MAPKISWKKKIVVMDTTNSSIPGSFIIFPVSYYQKRIDKDSLALQDLWVIAFNGHISECLLNPFLIGLLGSLDALDSAFFPLKLLFVFFFFLSGSLGGVGSGLGNRKIDEG